MHNGTNEFKGYRILLAEDGEIDREIVTNLVEDLGAECVTVGDGDALLEMLKGPEGDKIDLVLTDINMPGKSGIDACAEFRASMHPKSWTLPIIGISADTNPALFDKAISAGMNSMTLKPLTRDTLRAHFHITLKDNMANAVFSDRIRQALAKSLFFSTVAHDIRTPLNAIIGFSEMLKQGFDSPAEQEVAVDSILMSSNALLQLVNDILDLSKLESGRMNIEPEPTDVPMLLREIAASFGVTHQKAGFEILCHAGQIPALMLDPYRLRQIAFNLVGNAVKFTQKGFVDIRASFKPDETGRKGVFRMEVQDTGCGISASDQKKLATPFVQIGAGASRRSGTGLGLHICRLLARAMGGEMQIDSVLGKGATFSIVVPGVRVAEVAACPAKSEASSLTLRNIRVLVADDTKLNQLVLKSMFARIGVSDVTLASNGREALDILESQGADAFDLVLTDMWMPEMCGTELVASIRANPALAKIPVYLFTAEVEMKQTYAENGFDGILLKPATLDALRKILP
jgi:signal transduction histidine kinase